MRVFVEGLASEPKPLHDALLAAPQAAKRVHWHGAMVPGVNDFDYAALDQQASFLGPFVGSARADSASQGRSELQPMHYSQLFRYYSGERFDLVLVHVTPPDSRGMCSLGVNADFAEAVLPGARTVLAYVNSRMPFTNGPCVHWGELDYVVEIDRELPFPQDDLVDESTRQLAEHVVEWIRDGDCIQVGLGKLANVVLSRLTAHRNLGLHCGLVGDGVLAPLESGALTGARKTVDRGLVVTNGVYGSARLYDLAHDEAFAFRNVAHTHGLSVLANMDNLVSINSALEVDLLGQVNVETIGGRQISGVGGALDFARGAAASRNGRHLVTLASTTASGRSRIVTRFSHDTPVTYTRHDVGIVVTEHGSADLRGLSTNERARALIAIADPSARENLSREWAATVSGHLGPLRGARQTT